jgi:oligopeptide/dipeptide ABC transporter ATP-binding protein
MQQELGMSILLITHDLGVVAETSDRVAVMYAGKIVESTSTAALFAAPRHPYTFGLFQSLPEMHDGTHARLREIPGTVPHPLALPGGCRFRSRCFKATPECAADEPSLSAIAAGHTLACHHPITDAELAAARAGTPGDGPAAAPAPGGEACT